MKLIRPPPETLKTRVALDAETAASAARRRIEDPEGLEKEKAESRRSDSEEAGCIRAAGAGTRKTLIAVRPRSAHRPGSCASSGCRARQHISVIPPAQQSMPSSDEAAASGA
jgi:hypothetical protein